MLFHNLSFTMSNSVAFPRKFDSQHGSESDADPLRSISYGRFSNMPLSKPPLQIRLHTTIGLKAVPKNEKRNSTAPISPPTHACEIKPNFKMDTNNADLQSSQTELLKMKADTNDLPSSRFLTRKTYAIVFLLLLLMSFAQYGALFGGASRWIPDVLKLKADNLAIHQIPMKTQNNEKEKICLLKRAYPNFCNITEEKKERNRILKASGKNSVLKDLAEQSFLNYRNHKFILSEYVVSFEKLFLATMKKLIYNATEKGSSNFFHEWLHLILVSTTEDIAKRLMLDFQTGKDKTTKHFCADENQKMGKDHTKYQDETTVDKQNAYKKQYKASVFQELFVEMMLRYNTDKEKLEDFALESAGGKILAVKQTENYIENDVPYGFLSYITFKKLTNSPKEAIQPGMEPGECWAFKRNQGILVIQLAKSIHPTGFTIEHISVSQSPSGHINSAPKDFSVWGLLSESDNEGKTFGLYTYNLNGYPLQYFPAQFEFNQPFKFVELRILSNHGNIKYTCLYRFRVHGRVAKRTYHKIIVF